jgi:hypothetical protein
MTLYGPQVALIAASFAPRLRYSSGELGYQLASIIAGGPAPFIAAALFAAYQSGYAIAFYILGCGFISIIAALVLKDHTNKDIDEVDKYIDEVDVGPLQSPQPTDQGESEMAAVG